MSKLGFFSFLFLELCPRVNSNHTNWDLLCLRTNTQSPHVISGFLLGFLGHCFFVCVFLFSFPLLSSLPGHVAFRGFRWLLYSQFLFGLIPHLLGLHSYEYLSTLMSSLDRAAVSVIFPPFHSFSVFFFFPLVFLSHCCLALFSPCISNSLIVACL